MGNIRHLPAAASHVLQRAGTAIAKRGATVARDVSGVAGAALVAYGAWLIYRPAGFIVGGVFMLAAAFLSATST